MYSTKPNPTSAKERREELKKQMLEYHSLTIESNDIEGGSFYPKVPYMKNGEQYIGLYERELTNTFYTELATQDYSSPYSPERTLYVWKGNKNHIEEYETDNSGDRYLVPIQELQVVKRVEKPEPIKFTPADIEISDSQDDHMNKMTIRDRCAIEWKLPVSTKDWLNKLITDTFNKKK